MDNNRLKKSSPYFDYFKILFESFEKNTNKDLIGDYYKSDSSSESKSKEFKSYINNFLKEKLDKN